MSPRASETRHYYYDSCAATRAVERHARDAAAKAVAIGRIDSPRQFVLTRSGAQANTTSVSSPDAAAISVWISAIELGMADRAVPV